MTNKLLGSPGTVYSLYSDAFICSLEVRHMSHKVGNQATVMSVPLLRLETYLPSDALHRISLAA